MSRYTSVREQPSSPAACCGVRSLTSTPRIEQKRLVSNTANAGVLRKSRRIRRHSCSNGLVQNRVANRRSGRGLVERAGKPYAPYFGVVPVSGGVSGRVGREPAGLAVAEVGIAFVAEEDVSAADVFVLVGGVCGVPVVAGEFLVGAREEVVALGVVLADE
jgi:hypothetical protein